MATSDTLTSLARAAEQPRAQRQSQWSSDEVWRSWPLRWADSTSRSIMLVSLAFGGLLANYGLPLLLHQPPALIPAVTLRAIGVLLLLLAAAVAPASRGYRIAGVYCIVLFGLGTAAILMMQSTDLLGPTTYGALAAVEFATGATLLVAWLLARMRHPITILVAVLGFATAAGAFSARVMPLLRPRFAPDPWAESRSIVDETLAQGVILLLILGLILLSWWLDGWMRALLPVAHVAEPHGSGRPSRTGEQQRRRVAFITMLLGLDIIAIAVAISAKLPVNRGRISVEDDWWASIVLAVSTAKATMVVVAVTGLIIWWSDPVQRAMG